MNSNPTTLNQKALTKDDDVRGVQRSAALLWRFIQAMPLLKLLFIPTLFLSTIAVALPQLYLWLIGEYARCASEQCQMTLTNGLQFNLDVPLLLFVAISALIVRFASWTVFECGGMFAGNNLHAQVVSGLLNTRTTYYDEVPSGRLINRVVRDFDRLRVQGVIRIGDTIQAALELGAIGLTIGLVNAPLGLAMVPCAAVLLWWQAQLVPMAQRLSIMKSSRFGEVLHRETDLIDGGRIISLFGAKRAQQLRLKHALLEFVDAHVLRGNIEAAARFRFGALQAIYSAGVVLSVAAAIAYGSLSTVLGGVIIATVFRLAPALGWAIGTSSSLLESAADSKRVFEIIDLVPEANEELAAAGAHSNQEVSRANGQLAFVDYSMSYRRDLPPIFAGLHLELPLKKRI